MPELTAMGIHTVSYRDGISCEGNKSWMHAGKDYREAGGKEYSDLHFCYFGLSLICDGHIYCSWGSFVVARSRFGFLLPLVMGFIFSFWA